jgi:hypothetical protein
MGVYVKLGKHAFWIELRSEWRAQHAKIERIRHEWLIVLPLLQVIYTPA